MAQATGREGLDVLPGLVIPRSELEVRATRSGGPGGQHVNTSSTRVEVIWSPERSRALTDEQRAQLRARLAARLDAAGNVRVVASDTRSQARNRALAEERLVTLIRRGLAVPKRRKKTSPSRGAVERRLDEKKRRSRVKRERRSGDFDR